jgi:asparagine synthase (glutamine-hydrolysing)
MCQALQRSDQEGPIEWYSDSCFGVGRCRPFLINQPSQPAWNEDRTVCVFFHGELFGCQDLRRSLERKGHRFSDDSHAEFLVHLYEDRGDAFIHELNGGFALAIWDTRQQRLVIANDRYGLRPLYTAKSGTKYLWASAPKAILADTTFARRINLAAMADFLCLGIPQGNDTMFEGIDELPPASLVVCQRGQVHRQQYWSLRFQSEETGISANDCLDELVRLMKQAAERRQAGELSTGLLLSGGSDSRTVLHLLSKDTLKTFTYGTLFSEDMLFARQVAQVANVPHFCLEIRPDFLKTFARVGVERTEDLINCDRFHGISIYGEIASHVNVLITGTSAKQVLGCFDEIPRGWLRGDGYLADRYYDSHGIMTTDDELKQLVKPAYFQQMKGLARARLHRDFEECRSPFIDHQIEHWTLRHRHRRFINRMSNLFPHNLEYRPLFFDNDLVEFAQTIPPSLRWGENAVYRNVILLTAPELAGIPATTTYGLPLNAPYGQVARRKSQRQRSERWWRRMHKVSHGLFPSMKRSGFYVNYAEWLKRDLRDWSESILLDPRTLNRDYWNAFAITRLMEAHLRNRSGKRLARQLTALISFELWHRLYLDTE